MPTWLIAALELVGPITKVEPAVVALGHAIAQELKSGDSFAQKAVDIGKALLDFAQDVEHAIVSNTDAQPAAAGKDPASAA
jgi:hypothetical protein